ncbi:isa2p [Saccharomyces arboricola H-6]|uniref:Isa2p n=1 Tax=Saccharomyces arboricola (strain H-6 / AS 2.3317 / CBS 10644) TaxID=1160507 RepID=J8PY29_SACAR|nr:isa2p [Saccharomyces arboricola H-6]
MQAKLLLTRLNFGFSALSLRQFPLRCFPLKKTFYSDLAAKEPLITPKRIINGTPGRNLSISERASKRLAEIYHDSKENLRISVESGGCHGFQYNLTLEPASKSDGKPNDNDQEFLDDPGDDDTKDIVYVLPEDKGRVIIDNKSLDILNNTTLTYTNELIGSSFKIINGKLKSSCGCGSSFDIEN